MKKSVTLGISLSVLTALGTACRAGSETADAGRRRLVPDAAPEGTELDAGLEGDAGPTDVGAVITPVPQDGGIRDAGTRDGGLRDTNETFDQASMLMLGGNGTTGSINPTGDVDYYRFDGTGDSFVRVEITSNPSKDPALIDPVVTLYDTARAEVVQMNDLDADTIDPKLIYHLPATGTYYLKIEDISTARGDASPRGGPPFTYTVKVSRLDDAKPGLVIDGEPGDDVATARAVDLVDHEGAVYGSFRDERDVDVFRVDAHEPSILNVAFEDTSIFGSTGSHGRVWVATEAGAIVGRMDHDIGQFYMSPSIPAGTSFIFVSHRPSPSGPNAFYGFDVTLYGENSPEIGEPANDSAGGAEALTLTPWNDGRRRAFFLATLDEGDVDYFAFDVRRGESLNVNCGANVVGSGVRGLLGEVLDPALSVLASGSETPLRFLDIDEAPTATGTHYLRLTKMSQDPEVAGNWVRCVVSLIPAAAP